MVIMHGGRCNFKSPLPFVTALQEGRTPLHLASKSGSAAGPVVRLLLERGAVVDARDEVRLELRRTEGAWLALLTDGRIEQ